MNPRVLFLIGAMLVSPAWAEEPSFDFNSDAIKQIVRDTAATQYAPVQLSEEKPAATEPEMTVRFVPPLKEEAPPKSKPPRPYPAAMPSNGLLSGLIESLVDEALGDHYEACRRP